MPYKSNKFGLITEIALTTLIAACGTDNQTNNLTPDSSNDTSTELDAGIGDISDTASDLIRLTLESPDSSETDSGSTPYHEPTTSENGEFQPPIDSDIEKPEALNTEADLQIWADADTLASAGDIHPGSSEYPRTLPETQPRSGRTTRTPNNGTLTRLSHEFIEAQKDIEANFRVTIHFTDFEEWQRSNVGIRTNRVAPAAMISDLNIQLLTTFGDFNCELTNTPGYNLYFDGDGITYYLYDCGTTTIPSTRETLPHIIESYITVNGNFEALTGRTFIEEISVSPLNPETQVSRVSVNQNARITGGNAALFLTNHYNTEIPPIGTGLFPQTLIATDGAFNVTAIASKLQTNVTYGPELQFTTRSGDIGISRFPVDEYFYHIRTITAETENVEVLEDGTIVISDTRDQTSRRIANAIISIGGATALGRPSGTPGTQVISKPNQFIAPTSCYERSECTAEQPQTSIETYERCSDELPEHTCETGENISIAIRINESDPSMSNIFNNEYRFVKAAGNILWIQSDAESLTIYYPDGTISEAEYIDLENGERRFSINTMMGEYSVINPTGATLCFQFCDPEECGEGILVIPDMQCCEYSSYVPTEELSQCNPEI